MRPARSEVAVANRSFRKGTLSYENVYECQSTDASDGKSHKRRPNPTWQEVRTQDLYQVRSTMTLPPSPAHLSTRTDHATWISPSAAGFCTRPRSNMLTRARTSTRASRARWSDAHCRFTAWGVQGCHQIASACARRAMCMRSGQRAQWRHGEQIVNHSRVRDWAKGYAYLAHGTVRRTPILSKPVEGSLCDSRPEERGRCEHA